MTRKDVESLFKTHYTQMYHLALTLLFDEAESKDVVSEVFASLISGKAAIKREQSDAGISSAEREQARPEVKVVMKADNAKAFLLASVRHRCLNVLQHKQVKERFARLLTEDSDALISHDTAEEQMQMEELMRYLQNSLSLREMTCQEVAEALNVSRQTVHTHLKQSVEKIRKYFNSNSKAI